MTSDSGVGSHASLCAVAAALFVALSSPLAVAGPYEDADAAIKADNEDRALAILRPLATKGETRAQYEVGQLLYLFKKQDREAKRLFELAAAKGHGEAMYYLGNMYHNGSPVPQSFVEAYKWYALAVVHASPQRPGYGDPKEQAIKNRDFVAKKMTTVQIAEAQGLVKEWKPQKQPQVQTETVEPKAVNQLIKYECVKTDNSGVIWLVEANAATKQVTFLTKFPNGPTNSSGPHPATISADKITWAWRFTAGKTWSQTIRTIDRRTGKGTIEITSPDDKPWSERNIPCKPVS
jgi:hypothetical protein